MPKKKNRSNEFIGGDIRSNEHRRIAQQEWMTAIGIGGVSFPRAI